LQTAEVRVTLRDNAADFRLTLCGACAEMDLEKIESWIYNPQKRRKEI